MDRNLWVGPGGGDPSISILKRKPYCCPCKQVDQNYRGPIYQNVIADNTQKSTLRIPDNLTARTMY
jgi:cytochrome c551/c552